MSDLPPGPRDVRGFASESRSFSTNEVTAERLLAALDYPSAPELRDSPMGQTAQSVRAFMAQYEYGLQEITTKVEILSDQFLLRGGHNPIEHVKTRLKSPESILAKARRRNVPLDLESIREHIQDIAGIRITCPYVDDAYQISDALRRQQDLVTVQVKDYIRAPKPNGYRSLHLHLGVPVYLPDETIMVPVEVQIRTIAMDFWASTEHELHYKFEGALPPEVSATLTDLAQIAATMDARMAPLRSLVVRQTNPGSGRQPVR